MITNVNGNAANLLPSPTRSHGSDTLDSTADIHVEAQPSKFESLGPAITLRIDESTHEVIAVVKDRETNKVIREIPPEEMRTASEVIRALIGRLVDKRV
jgi:uncharacterized FlaG/YvyC family protein